MATLLKTDLEIGDIYAHYCDATAQSLSWEKLFAADQRLLLEHYRPGSPHVVGLDIARNAVDYAVATGALDAGIVENLELDDPSARLTELLSDVDLITTTGGVGYVTHRTFERLLKVTSGSAWVAAFCLRTYDYEPIAETLSSHGLHTERVTRTFPQRRFTGPEEKQWAVSEVRSRGVDPTGKEDDGFYHAELCLSRPAGKSPRDHWPNCCPGCRDLNATRQARRARYRRSPPERGVVGNSTARGG